MAEQEEQSVVDQTDTDSQQSSAEGGDAQGEDLDTLLSQWDESAGQDSKESTESASGDATDSDEAKEILADLKREREELWRERTNKEINEIVSNLKEDLPTPLPDRFLKGELYRLADEDPRFMNAFQNRRTNPDRWNKTVKALKKEIAQELQGVDQSTTADREAVASAVRSASKTPPAEKELTEDDINNMSDSDFEKMKQGMLHQ